MKMNNPIAATAILAAALVLAGCDSKPAPQEQAKAPPQQLQPPQPQQAEPPKPKPVPLLAQPVGSLVERNTPRGTELLQKYGDRIHYENEQAKIAIETFYVDCDQFPFFDNGSYYPLVNLLAAVIMDGTRGGFEMNLFVQSREGETRVIEHSVKRERELAYVLFRINKWGELTSSNKYALRGFCRNDNQQLGYGLVIIPPKAQEQAGN